MENFLDSPLGLLAFLSLFHVIGAMALAYGLRGVWSGLREKKPGVGSRLFFVLWGAMFGCMPFAFGLGLATEDGGTPFVLLGQALIWGSVFLIALLAWDDILDWLRPFLHADVFLVAFGGLFMLVGTGVAALIARDELLFGLLFGGIFTLVGGLCFALGVWRLLKSIR